jgi:hypothetical protein
VSLCGTVRVGRKFRLHNSDFVRLNERSPDDRIALVQSKILQCNEIQLCVKK